jgi:tetratricopeptide (TPR) repeat protein
MKKLLILTTLTALILGCAKSPDEVRQTMFEEGVEKLRMSQFSEADETFKQLRTEFPASVLGRFGEGLVLEAQLLFHDAMQIFLETIEAEPAFSPAYAASARVYARRNRLEASAGEYSRAAAFQNCDVLTRARLVSARISLRDFDAAQRALADAEASGLDRNITAVLTSQLQYHRQQIDSSLLSLKAALDNPPDIADFYVHLANQYEDRGMIDSAIEVSSRSLSSGDTGFEHLHEHFLRCLRHDYYYQARRLIDSVQDLDQAGSLFHGLQLFYSWSSKDSRQASSSNIEYRRANEDRFSAILYDIPTRWMSADILACGDALDLLRSLISPPELGRSFKDFMLGEIELESMILGNATIESSEQIRATKQWADGEREFRLIDAYITFRGGQLNQFKQTLDSFMVRHSADPIWLKGMADVCARKLVGLYDEAENYYRQALQQDHLYPAALENWVKMYEDRRMFAEARDLLRDYSQLVEVYPELSLLEAIQLIRTGEVDAGIELFRQNIVHVRGKLSWYERFSETLDHQGEQSQAIAVATSATDHGPENPDTYIVAARVLSDHGEYDTALSLTETGLEIEPNSNRLAVQKARALYMTGEEDKAMELFEKTMKPLSGSIDANLYYSQCLASTGTAKRKATNYARAAVFQSRGSLKTLINLCDVYHGFSLYKNMRGEGRRASNSYPFSPEANYYLGLAYHNLGDPEAKSKLEQAIELGLWGRNLETARDVLKKL